MAKRGPVASWLHVEPERLDRFDYVYVELVDARPEAPRHEWCELDAMAQYAMASVESGRVHLGGRTWRIEGGILVEDADDEGHTHPTHYEPDPRLKGGKDR